MKIQFLNGGLANQAFQYIFCRYYELSYPGDVIYMDDSYFALHTVHNGYELEKVFGIRAHMLSECFTKDVWDFILSERKKGKSVPQVLLENQIEIRMITDNQNYKHFNPFDGEVHPIPEPLYLQDILEQTGNIYYHGYWFNPFFFQEYKEIFLKDFHFPEITEPYNIDYAREIQNSDSVSIHIRRGDYVTLGWAIDIDSHRTCIETFLSSTPSQPWHLFIFSDDIAWCKEHCSELGFSQFHKFTYVEGNTNGKNFRDLQLMSMCRAMILSNSAFCFLAALLNTRKEFMLNPTNLECPL
ncbi:MAG: alpha-1,2-fucosyltransferase [Lachnospiraceae bacterium]|nr:alpha-1,2-fucosyltransferase [Lachnospiraceae bacterium]